MSGHVFDHGAGRKLPVSTRVAAIVLLGVGLACTALWATLHAVVVAASSQAKPGDSSADGADPRGEQSAEGMQAARGGETPPYPHVDPDAIDGEDPQALSAAIRAGLNIDAMDARGYTPLGRAALLARGATIELLVARGADVRVRDARGRTALQLAAAAGDIECVRALLNAGADPRIADDHAWTALHEAAAHGHSVVVQALANVLDRRTFDARTSRGATALHWAARHGDSNCVGALLDAGAAMDVRDANGWLARDLAPREVSDEAWTRLGPPTPRPAARRPDPVLLDSAERRPAIYLCFRPASTSRGPLVHLELAIWRDGATLFAPWSADGTRDYVAGVISPAMVKGVFLDLEETGWLDRKQMPVDQGRSDCVELVIERRGRAARTIWEQFEHPELDLTSGARAEIVDWRLGRSKVLDILRSARPATTQSLSFVLIRGSFRGISFEDGARASWLD